MSGTINKSVKQTNKTTGSTRQGNTSKRTNDVARQGRDTNREGNSRPRDTTGKGNGVEKQGNDTTKQGSGTNRQGDTASRKRNGTDRQDISDRQRNNKGNDNTGERNDTRNGTSKQGNGGQNKEGNSSDKQGNGTNGNGHGTDKQGNASDKQGDRKNTQRNGDVKQGNSTNKQGDGEVGQGDSTNSQGIGTNQQGSGADRKGNASVNKDAKNRKGVQNVSSNQGNDADRPQSANNGKSNVSSADRDTSGSVAPTSKPSGNHSGTTSNADRKSKPDDGTADERDPGSVDGTKNGVDGDGRKPGGASGTGARQGNKKGTKTSSEGHVSPTNNRSSAINVNGQEIKRVLESPRQDDSRPRNQISSTEKRSRVSGGQAMQSRVPKATPASSQREASAKSDGTVHDMDTEPCQKCGVERVLLQSKGCEHKVCKPCLPEDVYKLTETTDCPLCQQLVFFAGSEVKPLHTTFSRFHLVKSIYENIHPVLCQKCKEADAAGEGAKKADVATCVCKECALYMCEPCADAHSNETFAAGKGWRNHHIFFLEDVTDKDTLPPEPLEVPAAEVLYCPKHPDSEATCYCRTCRGAFCAPCRNEHRDEKHDFLDKLEATVFLKELVNQEAKSAKYEASSFDHFSAAVKKKQERATEDLQRNKQDVLAKFGELIRRIERQRDDIVDEMDKHTSDVMKRGNELQEWIKEDREYADAVKKLLGVFNTDSAAKLSDDDNFVLLRLGEFVDQNDAELKEKRISQNLVSTTNECCKMVSAVRIVPHVQEDILELIERYITHEVKEEYWLNEEALLAMTHLRHTTDDTVCHVGSFRENEQPYYQFLWPVTSPGKFRDYYGRKTFILNGNNLRCEDGTSPDLVQSEIAKNQRFQVFVKTPAQRLDKIEVELFRNTQNSTSLTREGHSVSGLVTFCRNGTDKTMAMVSGSKVIVARDDKVVRRQHIGSGSKVIGLDRSGNILIPFLIGKLVVKSRDGEETIFLNPEEHCVMYNHDDSMEYLWTMDLAENMVKVYDYRKLAFIHGLHCITD